MLRYSSNKQQPTAVRINEAKEKALSVTAGNQSALQSLTVLQRKVKEGDSYLTADALIEKYEVLSEYRDFVDELIGEETEYTPEAAYDELIDRISTTHKVDVDVEKLLSRLDPVQHPVDTIGYEGDAFSCPANYYNLERLNYIKENEIYSKEPIIFENVTADEPITTTDGRHRLAVCHYLRIARIKANVDTRQLKVLRDVGLTSD